MTFDDNEYPFAGTNFERLPTEVRLSAIPDSLQIIGSGGSAQLRSLPNENWAFKEYLSDRVPPDLPFLVDLYHESATNRRSLSIQKFAWPISVVVDPQGGIKGTILPLAPSNFWTQTTVRRTRLAQDINFAIYSERSERIGIQPLSRQQKLELLLDIVESVSRLQALNLLHPDLTPRNILWSAEVGQPIRTYILDADSIFRVGDPAGPQYAVVTPGWTDPRISTRKISTPDYASVSYDIGLMAARLVAGPYWAPAAADNEVDALPRWLPRGVAALIRRSTSPDANMRPRVAEWYASLQDAVKQPVVEPLSPRRQQESVIYGTSVGGASWDTRARILSAVASVLGVLIALLAIAVFIAEQGR